MWSTLWSKFVDDLICLADVVMGCSWCKGWMILFFREEAGEFENKILQSCLFYKMFMHTTTAG